MNEELKPGEIVQIYDGSVEMYLIGCAECGHPVKIWHIPSSGKTFKCKECRKIEAAQSKDKLDKEIETLTQKQRLEKAKKLIEKQGRNLADYDHAIKIIEPLLGRPKWFQSIGEMIVALELVRTKIKFNHQVKLGRYKIDFVLPELKVILEIDGSFHKMKETKAKDKLKDATVVMSFGFDWEIIRITDDLVKQNIQQLMPAIKKILATRKSLRRQNKGQLPKKYTKQI